MNKLSKISTKNIVNNNVLEYVREDGSKEFRIGRTASSMARRATNQVRRETEENLEFQAGRLVAWHAKLGVNMSQEEAERLLIEKRKELREVLAETFLKVRNDDGHDPEKLKKLTKRAKSAKLFSTIANMVMDERFEKVIAEIETPQQIAKRVLG